MVRFADNITSAMESDVSRCQGLLLTHHHFNILAGGSVVSLVQGDILTYLLGIVVLNGL